MQRSKWHLSRKSVDSRTFNIHILFKTFIDFFKLLLLSRSIYCRNG